MSCCAKPANIPINPYIHRHDDESEFVDSKAYKSLIGKIYYVIMTRVSISFAVCKLSQFMEVWRFFKHFL